MEIQLIVGRPFNEHDEADAPPVSMVNQSIVRGFGRTRIRWASALGSGIPEAVRSGGRAWGREERQPGGRAGRTRCPSDTRSSLAQLF